MKTLIFATTNLNKVIEIRSVLGNSFEILSLAEAGINIDIPEPYETLEENAIEKSSVVYNLKKIACFAEDSGLEVRALNGEPGVKSARYAGSDRNFDENITKLLNNLKGIAERFAEFKTLICLTINGKHNIFEGICEGIITEERRGHGGFGYDAVFIPNGSLKTFGEMSLSEKNTFSHRRKATEKLIAYLQSIDV
jgi:XTP/dITP diphosphohydrolase